MTEILESTTESKLPEYYYRAVGSNKNKYKKMLTTIGASSVSELLSQTIPNNLPRSTEQNIKVLTEEEAVSKLYEASKKNIKLITMLGMGFYDTIMPAPIRRHVLENAGWYTSYTPYQPEISQGRLEALLNFQQLVCELTGFEVANASLLDEGSAVVEAMLMSYRISGKNKSTILLHEDCHPAVKSVLNTRASAQNIKIIHLSVQQLKDLNNFSDVFAVILSYPDTWGQIIDVKPIIDKCINNEVMTILNCDLMSLIKLKSPAELNADIAIGTSQNYGQPIGFGGPHAAFISCKLKYIRSLPGRLVGVSYDRTGKPALRLTIQTREQHIRRDKATSNICTAQSLPAILASMFAVYHGYSGLLKIFCRIHGYAVGFAVFLNDCNVKLLSDNYFQTISFIDSGELNDVNGSSLSWYKLAYNAGFEIRRQNLNNKTIYSLSFDETFNDAKWTKLIQGFSTKNSEFDIKNYPAPKPCSPKFNASFIRKDIPLQQPVFLNHRTETALLRYSRSLMDKDLALDRSMIPLGSCTMKINPAIAMETLSIKGLSDIHPYTNKDNATGIIEIINELTEDLKKLTGFDHVSIQPNAGSQGEIAGLLAIKQYFNSIKQINRKICLIPQSAHGTNPASATSAGLEVVLIPSTMQGNIDEKGLDNLIEKYGDQIALLMMTYPSTHGVFEESVLSTISKIKSIGAQIYIDGANLNAMLGLVRIGDLGADVCHMNLHKTFAIPHGGGGPGVGPIGFKNHLLPFIPGNPLIHNDRAVCTSEYGSSSILTISWMYIKLLGYFGLQQSSIRAIINANYLAHELKDYFPIVYKGVNGRLAHECILDCRKYLSEAGVTVDDIAKRLIDYGIHAPTVSWPVAGTIMVEPTESESKETIDNFIESMKLICREINSIKSGKWSKQDNPLVNAPHVLTDLLEEKWEHPYSKKIAFTDKSYTKFKSKSEYLTGCARIDQLYGDKNIQLAFPDS